MYTCSQGLQKITGISLIEDTGTNSDHVLVLSKIDLGIEIFQASKEQEERVDFKRIMNIPMWYKPGEQHPSINQNVYKGADFRMHVKLYDDIQEVIHDASNGFLKIIQDIHDQMQQLEIKVIQRTKNTISIEEQLNGKLIGHREKQLSSTMPLQPFSP